MHVKAKYDLICNDTFFAQMFFNLVGDLVGMSMQGFQLIFDRNPQLDWGLGKDETDIFFFSFFFYLHVRYITNVRLFVIL